MKQEKLITILNIVLRIIIRINSDKDKKEIWMKKIFLLILLGLAVTSCIVVEDGYRGTRVRVRRPPVIIIG